MAVGESRSVEIRVNDRGGWSEVDVAAGHWETGAPVPARAAPGDTLRGRATLVADDQLDIDFGDVPITFGGPISCE